MNEFHYEFMSHDPFPNEPNRISNEPVNIYFI